jgi:ABC-type Zn uptake system ZnuABC Zn-binding protein ZnuA
MKRKRIHNRWTGLASAAVTLALIAAACSSGDDQPDIGCNRGTVSVTVTLPMFADFACQVGGEHVRVQALLPLDADPHSYTPPEEDANLVADAELVLYAGLGLDAPALEFIFTHGRGSAQIIGYSRSITSPTVEQPPPDEPRIDAEKAGDNPYLWLDPELAIGYADITRDSLEIVDAEHITTYQTEFARYRSELQDLYGDILLEMQTIPEARRKFVTLHDSMVHFARRFGFEVVGYLEEPGQSPTQEEIDALAQQVRDTGVPAVFTERGYDESPMQQVAEAAGVRLCSLYTDRADSEASTYVEMMRHNQEEISRCLGS